jgi:hypothetical protein
MRSTTARIVALLAAALLGFHPATAQAQLGAHVVATRIDHELMGNATGGYVHIPLGSTKFRVGYEFVRGSAADIRSECAGLVNPQVDCSPKPGMNHYSLHSILAEYMHPVLRRGSFAVGVSISGRLSGISSKFRVNATGLQLAATDNAIGGHAGVTASWLPWRTGRAGFELGGSVGGLHSILQQTCCDVYEPFSDDFTFTRISLGFVYRPAPR